jgi:sugar lactone lactonase YvrE
MNLRNGRSTRMKRLLGLGVAAMAVVVVASASGGPSVRTITTFAGSSPVNGSGGFSGDGGPATKARLDHPRSVAVDRKGNVYIADTQNARIRKVSPGGRITTFAGTGKPGGCRATALPGDGGPATSAPLCAPEAVAVDRRGNVYFDQFIRIRKVDPGGTISTFAGGGTPNTRGDGGPATSADLNLTGGQGGIAADARGNVYFSDITSVRKVDPGGTITTFAGIAGKRGFSGDAGPAISAMLNEPLGIAVDRKGNVYIADARNYRIRKVSPAGTITTFAGTGKPGYYRDGARATSAPLGFPVGVAVDPRGNVYIADSGTRTVAWVSPGGRITRLAGPGDQYELGDGGPARSGWLNSPYGVATDAKGNVYIVDWNQNRVRKVTKP